MTEDHDDDLPCYRHPSELTALRCITCDRPICVDCAIAAPVGFKCPDHGRTTRAERGVVPTDRVARGVVAGLVAAIIFGVLLSVMQVPFLGIILAWVAGSAVGEITRRASGGYRDPLLAKLAAASAAVGMLALPVTWLVNGSSIGAWLAWTIVSAGAAAYGAFTRAS